MKSIGKFILLFITHELIVVVGGSILSVIFHLLRQLGVEHLVTYWMTGISLKLPVEVMIAIVCFISYFVCSRISDKLKARKPLFIFGIVLVVLNILFFISNIIYGKVTIGYIIQTILGVAFIYSNRPVKDTI